MKKRRTPKSTDLSPIDEPALASALNHPPEVPPRERSGLTAACVSAALLILSLAVYAPVRHFDFINWDDPDYVKENVHIAHGLDRQAVEWAFTAAYAGNWHPLTWMSHMMDIQFFGNDPGPQHVVNAVIHSIDAVLLFLAFYWMTGSAASSAFTAALFAVHPLHVESVAWISERKDVLSAFFWMLALLAYASYTRKRGVFRYFLVLLAFAFGLMAKPMVVTLPFILLLLDIWPLQRVRLEAGQRRVWRSLIVEKLPLLALTIASSVITFLVQSRASAVATLVQTPIGDRLANVIDSYVQYIRQTVWPAGMAAFYPYTAVPLWRVGAGFLVLSALSFLVLRNAVRRPYLLTGWFWYLGTLVPVIGIVQVGAQARADRYTYVPTIGLFIVVAWGVPEIFSRWRRSRFVLGVAGTAIVAACALLAREQLLYWKNPEAVWDRALAVTSDNYAAHLNLGIVLDEQGRSSEALEHYKEALAIKPNLSKAHNALGAFLAREKHFDAALAEYREAIEIQPDLPGVRRNMGAALGGLGRTDEAIDEFRMELLQNPDDPFTHYDLGFAFAAQGHLDQAIAEYTQALSFRPEYPDAETELANILASQGKTDDAISHYNAALALKPDSPLAHHNLGLLLAREGKIDEAVAHYREAIRLDPGFSVAHNSLGTVLANRGELNEAIAQFREALRLMPGYPDALGNLNLALAMQTKPSGKRE